MVFFPVQPNWSGLPPISAPASPALDSDSSLLTAGQFLALRPQGCAAVVDRRGRVVGMVTAQAVLGAMVQSLNTTSAVAPLSDPLAPDAIGPNCAMAADRSKIIAPMLHSLTVADVVQSVPFLTENLSPAQVWLKFQHCDLPCLPQVDAEGTLLALVPRPVQPEEQSFRSIFNQAPIGICQADADGVIQWVNPCFANLLGYTIPDLVGRTFQALTYGDDLERDLKLYHALLQRERDIFTLEKRYLSKGGEPCWVSITVCRLEDALGEVYATLGVVEDIRDRKEAEIALQDSQRHIVDILESMTDGFFALDEQLCFTYVNQRAEELLHHHRDQLLEHQIWEIFPSAISTVFQTAYEIVLRENITQTFEAFYPPFQVWYEVHAYPIPTGLAVYFKDITIRKTAYDQLAYQVQREQALNQVIQVIHQSLDLDTVFSTVVEAVAPLLGNSWVSILQYLPEPNCWRIMASYSGEAEPPLPVGSDISDQDNGIGEKLRAGEVIAITDTRQMIDAINTPLAADRAESWLLVPFQLAGHPEIWGNLTLSRPCNGDRSVWQPEEITLARTIASQIAIAIQQAQVYEQAQQELAERQRAEERLREAQKLARLGNWELMVSTQKWLWSDQVFRLFGLPIAATPPSLAEQITYIHPDDRALWQEILTLAQFTGQSFQLDCRLCPMGEPPRYVSLLGDAECNPEGQVVRIFGTLMDITERRQFEDQLAYEAYHDPLTGAPNRAFFMEYLQASSKQAQMAPDSYAFAVLFIDLDRFKVINDSLGHLTGDRLLMACTQRLATVARDCDVFARLSGDEFALLLDNVPDLNWAITIAEHLQTALRDPFLIDGRELFVSASIGIASSLNGSIDPVDCLRDADIAMFQAKERGRNRCVVFNPAMHVENTTRLILETDLQRAIERDELQVVYQPIVRLDTGRISGFEALARWNHPHFGPIQPSQFIPLAEETGAILLIGRWIRHRACAQLRQWQQALPQAQHLTMSVNLSVKQFSSLRLLDRIQETLRETGLAGHHLRLEITESALIDNPAMAAVILSNLRGQGIELCIDDFGTGYSSLSMVHQYPVQVLKIDRSFVNRLEEDHRGVAMVKTILALAHSLEMEAIAEGVETAQQLQILKDLGCESAQGFFFSCALSAREAAELLTSQPTWLSD